MRSIITLFIISGLMILFKLAPENVYYDFWPFLDKTKSVQNYIWHLSNKIILCLLYFEIFMLISEKYKNYAALFLSMDILVVLEFVLRFNEPWIPVFGIFIGLTHIFIIFKALIVSHIIMISHSNGRASNNQ